MACIGNVRFWQEFIELYKSLPQLWKIKDESYYNKKLKLKGYNILKEKLREQEEDATVEIVKRKINNLRGCYRREVNKVRQSLKSGASPDVVYKPTLWYYENLNFLLEQECQQDGKSNEEVEIDPIGSSTQQNKTKRLEVKHNDLQSRTFASRTRERNDETKILSDSWSLLYRKLDPRQQLFANKAIIEVLYQGALGNLNENSWKAFENQPHLLENSSPAAFNSSPHELNSPSANSFYNNNFCVSSRSNSPQYILKPVPTRLTVAHTKTEVENDTKYENGKPLEGHNLKRKYKKVVETQKQNSVIWIGDDISDRDTDSSEYNYESEADQSDDILYQSEEENLDPTEVKTNQSAHKWNKVEETQRKAKLKRKK